MLTAAMKKSLDLLLSTRSKAGIAEENTFLFSRANVDSLQHLHGSDCLRQEAEKCGAKHPEYIRSTKLRKQIATIAQVINLKDHGLDILVSFMGHDIRIHKAFYRIPEPALQAAKSPNYCLAWSEGWSPHLLARVWTSLPSQWKIVVYFVEMCELSTPSTFLCICACITVAFTRCLISLSMNGALW